MSEIVPRENSSALADAEERLAEVRRRVGVLRWGGRVGLGGMLGNGYMAIHNFNIEFSKAGPRHWGDFWAIATGAVCAVVAVGSAVWSGEAYNRARDADRTAQAQENAIEAERLRVALAAEAAEATTPAPHTPELAEPQDAIPIQPVEFLRPDTTPGE